jgi:hypothetical protein
LYWLAFDFAGPGAGAAGFAVAGGPAPRLGGEPGLAARRAPPQQVARPRRHRRAAELDFDSREPADIGLQPATARGQAGGDLVESPLRLVGVEPARAIGRLRSRSLPDLHHQLARQQRIACRFGDRIERHPAARPLELRRMHPAHHRALACVRSRPQPYRLVITTALQLRIRSLRATQSHKRVRDTLPELNRDSYLSQTTAVRMPRILHHRAKILLSRHCRASPIYRLGGAPVNAGRPSVISSQLAFESVKM